LRTKQQVGYIVQSGIFRVDKRIFFNAAVQSNTICPRDLLSRTELFLENFIVDLKGDDCAARFVDIKKTLLESYREPFTSLDGKLNNLFHLAYHEECNWGLIASKIRALEGVEMEHVVEFARRVLGRENKKRIAVLVAGNSPDNCGFVYSKL
jgi:secreted Zn-dependent insulinase-like peptidase